MSPQEVIDSRYRLERLLGAGGMSEVWLAEDLRLRRPVAVKVLREPVLAGESISRTTLDREARIVARLQHPHIVAVLDSGEVGSQPYLVMEFVEGSTLRALLEQRGHLSEGEAIRYGAEIADALAFAHGQGVVHSDIKPENVLITRDGNSKVMDFGIAETLTRTVTPDQARELMGSLPYLSPEVLQGASPTERSDIYALGLTVYEMVAGRLPFAGGNIAAVAAQRLAASPPALRTYATHASFRLESALARALSATPGDRFETAAEFAEALRSVPDAGPALLAQAAPSAFRPRSLPFTSGPPRAQAAREVPPPAGRRRRLLALAGGLSFMGLVAGGGFVLNGDGGPAVGGAVPPTPTPVDTEDPTASDASISTLPPSTPTQVPKPTATLEERDEEKDDGDRDGNRGRGGGNSGRGGGR